MPQSDNELLQVYAVGTLFVGTSSSDLTTNILRRLAALTGEMTARFKAMIVSAGGSN